MQYRGTVRSASPPRQIETPRRSSGGMLRALCIGLVLLFPALPSPLRATETRVAEASAAAQQRAALRSIFHAGVERDWTSPYQSERFAAFVETLQPGQLTTIARLLNAAGTRAEQVFLLKALICGEPWENVARYAQEMRGLPEAEIVRRSTMREPENVIQQWHDSCGPAMLQVLAGEYDPRFAWELKKSEVGRVDTRADNPIAQQQKIWLESSGGEARPRGERGRGIPLMRFLNEQIGRFAAVEYTCIEITDLDDALDRISERLQAGFDVPLCTSWTTDATSHFMLLLGVRGSGGAREFQLYEPWTGRTAWVRASSLRERSIAPMSDYPTTVTHYYYPSKKW